jgi:hypothetical protein
MVRKLFLLSIPLLALIPSSVTAEDGHASSHYMEVDEFGRVTLECEYTEEVSWCTYYDYPTFTIGGIALARD